MIEKLVTLLFGCRHKKTTWPMSPRRPVGQKPAEFATVTCLSCGRERLYSFEKMAIVKSPRAKEALCRSSVPSR